MISPSLPDAIRMQDVRHIVTVPSSEWTETGRLVRATSVRLPEDQSVSSCRYETMESSPASPDAES